MPAPAIPKLFKKIYDDFIQENEPVRLRLLREIRVFRSKSRTSSETGCDILRWSTKGLSVVQDIIEVKVFRPDEIQANLQYEFWTPMEVWARPVQIPDVLAHTRLQ